MTLNPQEEPAAGRPGLVTAGRRIEEESFRIIDTEMGKHSFTPERWAVVRRVIHTTGDFDYASWFRFHSAAIASGAEALRQGAPLFADTRMIRAGLSPWRLGWYGTKVEVPASEPESQKWAEQLGTTRSVAAFRHEAQALDGAIVVVGNAPTALLEVCRLIKREGVRPALVIGVPVGFVQAAESKETLWALKDQPSITVLGRKGGSAVAVAIVHALLEWTRATSTEE